ncbi:MAG: hypothetical protein ACKO0Z_24580, partial [Betaproteobacteria bacterium]
LSDRVFYSWNYSTMTTVSDVDAPAADWVANIDGYYVASQYDTGQFYISANRDVTTWAALDFASAEKYPDNIVTGIVDHGELILFGTDSYEVWYNSGNADFPLDKVTSGHGEIGCISKYGVAKLDNGVFFPGTDGVVYRLSGMHRNGSAPTLLRLPSVRRMINSLLALLGLKRDTSSTV